MAKNDWMYGLLAALNIYTGATRGSQQKEERERRYRLQDSAEARAEAREERDVLNDEALRGYRNRQTEKQSSPYDDLATAAKELVPQSRRSTAFGLASEHADSNEGNLEKATAALREQMDKSPAPDREKFKTVFGDYDEKALKAAQDTHGKERTRLQDALSVLERVAQKRAARQAQGGMSTPQRAQPPASAPAVPTSRPSSATASAASGTTPQAMIPTRQQVQMAAQPQGQVNPQAAASMTMPKATGPTINQDPRMQSAVAEQIGMRYPQGPGATPQDQKMSGEVAFHNFMVSNPTATPEQQMASWFALHNLLGVPIPLMYQQWAQGVGIPKEQVEMLASQLTVGQQPGFGGQGPQPPKSSGYDWPAVDREAQRRRQ